MTTNPVIAVDRLCKQYRVHHSPVDRLKEALGVGRPRFQVVPALTDVSFAVGRGETVGIVGQNGAGKSTLLQILTGVTEATSGRAEVQGRIGSLLELGAGFHPDFDGLENVRLQGRLAGLSPADVEARLPRITAFAEIGEFVHQPVRTYSSGMFVRLAFACAIHLDPEVLIVDEALTVGDVFFQHKCMAFMRRFQQDGGTILLVSHDPQTIRHVCHRALHLRAGRLVADGDTGAVVAAYLQERVTMGVHAPRPPADLAQDGATDDDAGATDQIPRAAPLPAGCSRYGNGGAHVVGVTITDDAGQRLELAESGDAIRVRITVQCERPVARANVGFMLRDKKSLDVTGTNLAFERQPLPALAAGTALTVEFRLELPDLAPGNYSVAPAIADGDDVEYTMLDWVENAAVLELRAARPVLGHVRMPVGVRMSRHAGA